MSNNVIEVSECEAELLSIINDILSGRGEYYLERRSENYLTLVARRI